MSRQEQLRDGGRPACKHGAGGLDGVHTCCGSGSAPARQARCAWHSRAACACSCKVGRIDEDVAVKQGRWVWPPPPRRFGAQDCIESRAPPPHGLWGRLGAEGADQEGAFCSTLWSSLSATTQLGRGRALGPVCRAAPGLGTSTSPQRRRRPVRQQGMCEQCRRLGGLQLHSVSMDTRCTQAGTAQLWQRRERSDGWGLDPVGSSAARLRPHLWGW